MERHWSSHLPRLALCAMLALGGGCSRQKPAPAGRETDAPRRTLLVTGSSTMAPMVEQIAKRFQQSHPDVQISVQTGGSARGVEDARRGTADIGMASRALTDAENDVLGWPIARDGICLLVHRDNPVPSLSDQQVVAIYTGAATNWKEVGGADAAITVMSRSEGRSEVELFLHHFKLKKSDLKAQQALGDNAVAIEAVSTDPHAVVFISVGESERRAKDGVPIRLLPTAGVAASAQSVRTGNYPLSRPLTLVTKPAPSGLVEEFVNYCLSSQVTGLIREQGFVPYLD